MSMWTSVNKDRTPLSGELKLIEIDEETKEKIRKIFEEGHQEMLRQNSCCQGCIDLSVIPDRTFSTSSTSF